MTHLPLRIRVETTAFNSECAELGQLFSELAQRCPEVAETLCKCVVDFLDRPGGAFRLDSSATSPAGESAETLITLQFSQSFCVLVAAIRAAHREAMVLDEANGYLARMERKAHAEIAALRETIAAKDAEIDRLRGAFEQIDQWAKAYVM